MDEQERRSKCRAVCLFLLVMMGLLVATLGWLQIFRSREMEHWARRQQDYMTVVPGERGIICDRNGIVLNKSVPRYDLALRIEQIRDPRDTQRRTLDKVCAMVAELAGELGPSFYNARPTREKALRHLQRNTPMPFVLWKDVGEEARARWAAVKGRFPATELVMSWKRNYLHGDSAYHVRGATGLGQPVYPPEFRRYNLSYLELVGKSGMEEAFNSRLSGYGGYEQLRTDVFAYRHDSVESRKAKRGEDVRLTLDIKLQEGIEQLFRTFGYSGALVMMDLRTSGILASVSEPSPVYGEAGEPAEGAYVNRVLAGYYPPGSTLKPLVALTALQEQVVQPEERIECRGGYELPDGRVVACSHRYGHGALDLVQALGQSCNVYFSELAVRLGEDRMDLVGNDVGLGIAPLTELRRQEIAGIKFTPQWAREKRRSAWTLGDAANAGIGQGAWIVTPMQLLIGLSAVATGRLYHPTFVLRGYVSEQEGLGWDEEQRRCVVRGMVACVEEAGGTGHSMAMPGIRVMAKTGTAQAGVGVANHALVFMALPADNPQLAVVCVIEHGGSGGKVAGPIARQAMELALDKISLD